VKLRLSTDEFRDVERLGYTDVHEKRPDEGPGLCTRGGDRHLLAFYLRRAAYRFLAVFFAAFFAFFAIRVVPPFIRVL
jgi:hypothetical protein